ncbi:MAG: right-handed parallel beta-helix repeat-containing protein [Alteromonadaceae bacterium TMED7]|nr:hypothetical protein [Alteromonas sp.]RPH16090.1 MAG: right-handed parallel beta-helix repeat-containing protein [Alteromonadaceae bacterium TMED7]
MNNEAVSYKNDTQPGEIVYSYLSSNLTDDNSALLLLKNYKGPKKAKSIVKTYTTEISQLFEKDILSLAIDSDEQHKPTQLGGLSSKQATALFALFPMDAAKWIKLVSMHSQLEKNEIYEAAIAAGLDPSLAFTASSSGFATTATPLINSIGLVIHGHDEDSYASVRYMAADNTQWKKGLNLTWEPIYGSFAGSIVYLEANTTYDIEVEVADASGNSTIHTFTTTTKPNSPPIDPNNIHYLSDIYSGGQLDLEALNISGNENGYAKIIGDGQTIEVGDDILAAVNIGNQSYIMLENLTVKGGKRYGIFAKKAHHIWIKGCNVSEFGRKAVDIRNGVAYSSTTSNSPINYDSGIYLERSGIAVIEECEVHSPNLAANTWRNGHPKGANALQVWAYHDSDNYRGEFIVRNNKFYGSQNHRFNDVIEGRKNFERLGGFVRNSAIYGNYLAYANDDLIEIDGGQQNVLVYDNEMEQGYAGISIAPNMLGPSFIFHNHIHNLGDETGKEWTAIKAGGLITKPAGRTFIFENFIDVKRNGIAASRVNGDSTIWITSQNNVFFIRNTGNSVGYCILDKEKYTGSTSTNDLCYNQNMMDARYEFNYDNITEHVHSDDATYIDSLKAAAPPNLFIADEYVIPNFTKHVASHASIKEEETVWKFNAYDNRERHRGLPKQYKYGTTQIAGNNSVTLTGNNWRIFPIDLTLMKGSVLELTLSVQGNPEIVGIGFETNKSLTSSRVLKLSGSQDWGVNAESAFSLPSSVISFPIGEYITGEVNYLLLVLDNDEVESSLNSDKVTFSNIKILL